MVVVAYLRAVCSTKQRFKYNDCRGTKKATVLLLTYASFYFY